MTSEVERPRRSAVGLAQQNSTEAARGVLRPRASRVARRMARARSDRAVEADARSHGRPIRPRRRPAPATPHTNRRNSSRFSLDRRLAEAWNKEPGEQEGEEGQLDHVLVEDYERSQAAHLAIRFCNRNGNRFGVDIQTPKLHPTLHDRFLSACGSELWLFQIHSLTHDQRIETGHS
jgi:hypothetical protein